MTRTLLVGALIAVLLGTALSAQQSASEPAAWRSFVSTLPPGAFVAVRLKDGRQFKGTIVDSQADALLFKPRTRIPVPAGEIAFADIDSIELRKHGMTPGTKVVIGVGIVVGGVLLATVLVFLGAGY